MDRLEQEKRKPRLFVVTDTHGELPEIPDYVEINERDWLIHLGDSAGVAPTNLPCRRILVMGNHDSSIDFEDWDLVVDSIGISGLYFTHFPMDYLPRGFFVNVHGHLHDDNYLDYGFVKKDFHCRLIPNQLYLFRYNEDKDLHEVKSLIRIAVNCSTLEG